jgi:CRP-like cAMP-binding protein
VDRAKRIADGKAAILRRLESVARLFDSDREAIDNLAPSLVERAAGQELQASDTPLNEPRFVLSGWISRCTTLRDGRRQILDFYVTGDLVGYSSRHAAHAKASYQCLTNALCIDAADLIARTQSQPLRYPGLAAAWPEIEDEIEQRLMDQVVRNGRMLAHERVLHLMHELGRRHHRAGLGNGDGFVMPLTQEILGEALGLSTVHVNRTLQLLRREQIIRTALGRIEIINRQLLEAAMQAEE